MASVVTDYISLNELVTIGATVPTGLEFTALEEIQEKIEVGNCETAQGKVYFQTNISCLAKIHDLRSVDRLFLVIKTFKNYTYHENKEAAIEDLKRLPETLPWQDVAEFWKENRKHQKESLPTKKTKSSVCSQTVENTQQASNHNGLKYGKLEAMNDSSEDELVRFRASANRIGKKQSITSPDAETHFGGAIQDFTQWKVDLSYYNFEVLITLGSDFVMVCLSLTLQSLHRRNITSFGYTTLRASIAYNMLRMCKIKPGDIVIDPMCGSGSIPIESSREWPNVFYVAGDNSKVAVGKCLHNITNISTVPAKSVLDVLRWDVRSLPWRSGLVDVCITDLPFGKRVGSKMDNRCLYPEMLHELARISKLASARACILTNDKRSILNAISSVAMLWKLKRTSNINIGGLRAAVYLLQRTSLQVTSKLNI